MMSNQTEPMNSEDSIGINLHELIRLFRSNIKVIFLITSIFAAVSVAVSLSLPNIYSSRAILTITDKEIGGGSSSGPGAGFGGIAAMAGIQIASTSNDLGFTVIETIKSYDFLEHLINIEGVLQNLYAAIDYDAASDQIVYDDSLYDSKTEEWVIEKPTNVQAYGKYIGSIAVSKNKTNGFIYLNFSHFSPKFTKYFTNLIVKEVNEIIRLRDLEESIKSMKFLKSKLSDTSETEIRFTINELIKTEIKTQTFANIKENYAIEPVDSAFLPNQKSSPARALICIFGTLIGFILSYVFFVVRFFISPN